MWKHLFKNCFSSFCTYLLFYKSRHYSFYLFGRVLRHPGYRWGIKLIFNSTIYFPYRGIFLFFRLTLSVSSLHYLPCSIISRTFCHYYYLCLCLISTPFPAFFCLSFPNLLFFRLLLSPLYTVCCVDSVNQLVRCRGFIWTVREENSEKAENR